MLVGGLGHDRLFGGPGSDLIIVDTPLTGQDYSTFVDPTAGDRVLLAGAVDAGDRHKLQLSNTSGFQDYLDAATGSTIPNGRVSAFDFGGDTYLVVQNGASGGGFETGVDGVIKLAGVHTIGSLTAGVITLGS